MQDNPPRDYVYWTDCVSSVGELINEMRYSDLERDVTYETMLKHADGMLEKADELGYDRRSTQGAGVTLKNDWKVSFHKSFYCGVPCYYFVYSGIEYIWVKKGHEAEVQDCEERARADARPTTSLLARTFLPADPQDNPADLFELRSSVRNVTLHDHRTGEEVFQVYGKSVSDIVDLLEPTMVLSQDSRGFRASFGFDPGYIKKPTLAYAYQVRIRGDVGVQKVNQIGLIAETTKMVCGSFSLPAGSPRRGGCCLISSMRKPQICADCYAKTGHYLYPSKLIGAEAVKQWVVDALEQGGPEYLGELLAAAISDYYVRTHTETTSGLSMNPYYFRIHDAGDFGWYGPDYYRAWVIAAAMQPGIRFWAPTRDHLNKRMLRAYQTIERPENFILRPSALRFQDPPPFVDGLDAGTSSAYTAEGLPAPLDLVDHDCPAYAGTGHCESEQCRVCWDEPDVTVNYQPHNTTSKTNIPLLRRQL